jgi:hypothetical protein
MGTGSFLGVESSRGVTLTLTPSSAEDEKQSRAISLLSPRAFVACKKGETYFVISMYLCIPLTRTFCIVLPNMKETSNFKIADLTVIR